MVYLLFFPTFELPEGRDHMLLICVYKEEGLVMYGSKISGLPTIE